MSYEVETHGEREGERVSVVCSWVILGLAYHKLLGISISCSPLCLDKTMRMDVSPDVCDFVIRILLGMSQCSLPCAGPGQS